MIKIIYRVECNIPREPKLTCNDCDLQEVDVTLKTPNFTCKQMKNNLTKKSFKDTNDKGDDSQDKSIEDNNDGNNEVDRLFVLSLLPQFSQIYKSNKAELYMSFVNNIQQFTSTMSSNNNC